MGSLEGGDFSIMVAFPDLSSLSNDPTIGDVLSLPNSTFPYFWAWMLGGIWVVIVLSLYFGEKEKKVIESLLACMSVACFAILMLTMIGTIVGFVSLEIMIYFLVASIAIIAVWLFTTRRS